MSSHTSAGASCCIAILKQQQEGSLHHHQAGSPLVNANQPSTKNCTIVENGRVVVKPIQVVSPQSAESKGTVS